MNHRRRLGGYLLVMLALFSAGLMGPRAWATPPQTRPGQGISVPTATPVREWSPTVQPADTPRPAESSPEPPAVPNDTPAPGATPSTAATSTPALSRVPATSVPDAAALKLIKRANRLLIWRGQTVTFTLILTNSGQTSARQVSLADTLPDGLAPGPVRGTGAVWDGRTLRAQTPVLPPGGQLVVTFDAVVAPDARVGGLLVNRAQATAAGGLSANAEAFVALPPAELPAVGGD